MSDRPPSPPPADPEAALHLLQAELAETNREVMMLTLEMDKRVEARTAELKAAQQELQRTNQELMRLTFELEERVEERTQALRESEERFRSLADGAPVMIWVSDASGNTRFVNRTYREFFGVTLEEVEGGGWHPLIHPDDVGSYVTTFEQAIRDRAAFRAEVQVRRADGEWRWAASYAEPRFSPAGEFLGHAGVIPDITDRKRAEEALRESNERKNEFIAILSHELRNPLAPIRYALPLLEQEGLGEQARRAVSVIERQVRQLTRLVDDLLDVSRIARRKIELRRRRVRLGDVIASAVESSSPTLASARHHLSVTLPDEPVWLDADPERLAQVVTNLLNNSAKYTPRGGEVSLEAAREGVGTATIRVRDNGIGIPPESLPTLFEMFRQVDRADKSQGGLGIGLALSRQLVEMHGGRVEAFSGGTGRGSEFVVHLPTAGPGEAPLGHEAPAARAHSRRLKVLIVDDNADLVEMLGVLVDTLGHDTRKALDGRSAVAAARAYRPDVVLLDLGLPVTSGIEVARELRAMPETANVRLVALTGWGQAEDRRATAESGFDRHLTKPADPATLEQILAEFADERPQGQR